MKGPRTFPPLRPHLPTACPLPLLSYRCSRTSSLPSPTVASSSIDHLYSSPPCCCCRPPYPHLPCRSSCPKRRRARSLLPSVIAVLPRPRTATTRSPSRYHTAAATPPLQQPPAISAIPLHPLFSAADHHLPLLLNHSHHHPSLVIASFSSLITVVFPIFPMQAISTSAANPHCCLSSLPLSPPVGPHCSPTVAALVGLRCPAMSLPSLWQQPPASTSLTVGCCLLPPVPIADAIAILLPHLLPTVCRRCLPSAAIFFSLAVAAFTRLSSAVVAVPSSVAQPPLPSLLLHLPTSLLPYFQLPLLVATTFLLNRSLTCHVVASMSPTAALTAANRLCSPLADADNLVAVKSYHIYDICL
ncbi:hypothetical protein B296_00020296 [Ensete ventricosum]|uniref:Uncharacterized protein n=1 Tax=Ensete ventricosum TaxID=4639 RepID=A0A426Y148_ENSVE|nr:hypothetical protein B296_00020296 [Ensete ventricosum]